MRIYAVVVTSSDAPDRPMLVDAWDAAMVEENPAGWRRAVAEEALDHDVQAVAGIVIEVPTDAVLQLLRRPAPTVAATAIVPEGSVS